MDMKYHETVSKMEKMKVNKEYIQGWIGGYLDNPTREEQRLNEAYDAGYEDGKSHNADNFSSWVAG
jgi:hypothetical protein